MRTFLLSTLLLIGITLSAQPSNFWQSVNENRISLSPENDRGTIPSQYQTFGLELDDMKEYLERAPMHRTPEAKSNPLQLELPLPDGTLHQFNIIEAPVMQAEIAARYPQIRSFSGYSVTDNSTLVRFLYSTHGFRAFFKTPSANYSIQPYAEGIQDTYIVFDNKNEETPTDLNMSCGVHNDDEFFHIESALGGLDLDEDHGHNHQADSRSPTVVTDVFEYRLAMAGVAEWVNDQGSGTIADAMSSVATIVTLLNSVLGPEASLNFVLINENDQLLYLDPTSDPYNTVTTGLSLLGQNQANLDNTIGSSAYDIGHVMTIGCTDVGGVVSGTVCSLNGKGRGVTCQAGGLQNAILNIAVHEVAHQFNASHTWDNCPGSLPQRASGTAFEPGSGTTIMSYSGACGDQNITFNQGTYYHVGSLQQMYIHSRQGGGSDCPEVIPTDNNIPELTLDYFDGFHIPISTPFVLDGKATDADGDDLTYCWEQYNTGPLSQLGNPTGTAPSFRSFPPTAATERYFPRLQNVVQNNQTQVEVLPTYSRNLTFRCTVRDGQDIGGNTWEEISFEATAAAGPFRVDYPNSAETFVAGDYVEVLWDVANTDGNLVNCQEVNILLSNDGGFNYPYILAQSAPNDGSHFVTIPNEVTQGVRIKIEAADNIFYDLSNFNSEIIAPSTPGFAFDAGPYSQQSCAPDDILIELNTLSLLDYDSLVTFSVSGLPAGANAIFSSNPVTPADNATLTIETANIVDEGFFAIDITAIAQGGDTLVRPATFTIVLNDFSAVQPVSPANGSAAISELPTFTWDGSPNAFTYDIEIATNPSFAPGTIIETATTNLTTYTPTIVLDKNTLYFWRIRPKNVCGDGEYSVPQGFHTEVFVCSTHESTNVPLNISGVGTPVVESTLVINSQGEINDLNVTKLKGAHDWVEHIDAHLISPDGVEVLLFSDICGASTIFNLGLDDQAPSDIQCPATTGQTFKPQGNLSDFNNEPATGTWILRVTVNNTDGTGGVIEEWMLELCSNSSANAPFLVTNDVLPLPPGANRAVTNDFLLSEDDDNGPDELTYTVVTAPQHGTLYFQTTPVEVGMTFRQSSINAGNVSYTHDGGPEVTDGFTFAVEDGEGGWFGTPRFEIEIDPDVVISTKDLDNRYAFDLFPNPAQNLLNLKFGNPLNEEIEVSISNVQGQILQQQMSENFTDLLQVNTSKLSNGIYFIYVKNNSGAIATERFVIQR